VISWGLLNGSDTSSTARCGARADLAEVSTAFTMLSLVARDLAFSVVRMSRDAFLVNASHRDELLSSGTEPGLADIIASCWAPLSARLRYGVSTIVACAMRHDPAESIRLPAPSRPRSPPAWHGVFYRGNFARFVYLFQF